MKTFVNIIRWIISIPTAILAGLIVGGITFNLAKNQLSQDYSEFFRVLAITVTYMYCAVYIVPNNNWIMGIIAGSILSALYIAMLFAHVFIFRTPFSLGVHAAMVFGIIGAIGCAVEFVKDKDKLWPSTNKE